MSEFKNTSRRNFLRMAALGSGSLAFSSLMTSCRVEKIEQSTPTPEEEGTASTEEQESEETVEPVAEEEGHMETEAEESHSQGASISPIEALNQLLDGNRRFSSGGAIHPRRDADRRAALLAGQRPFAVILTCSDSRVSPETIFDQGLGDLFVIRTAGNVVDNIGLGSIEYAVEHLAVPLLVVMGHQHCGAVTAAVEGGEATGHIHRVVEKISPAVENARQMEGDLLANAIDANIAVVVEELRNSQPILHEYVATDRLEIIGMRYDLDNGIANFSYY